MSFLASWLPVILWAGVIFGLSSIPSLSTGWGLWDFILRKIAHMVEFAILTALLIRAFVRTWNSLPVQTVIRWCAVLAILYAGLDEFHQGFVPGRVRSFPDVLIDSCGVLLVLLVYRRRIHNV
jgi:VanZ family protein